MEAFKGFCEILGRSKVEIDGATLPSKSFYNKITSHYVGYTLGYAKNDLYLHPGPQEVDIKTEMIEPMLEKEQ